MRFIDLTKLAVPAEKLRALQKAMCEVENLPPEERSKEINTRESVWQNLKDNLADYSDDKCWYCESIQSRSDNAVDHFRPKNAVRKCPGHDGYWWLAFDWHNYRYVCTFCNSRRHDDETDQTGGKWDYFPLIDENQRVYDRSGDIEHEDPCLLNPTRPSDPMLLWFDQTGEAVERYSEIQDRRRFQKARQSIELYHLNHHNIREKRQILYNEVSSLVRQADRHYARLISNSEGKLSEDNFNDVVGKLIGMIRHKAEYSAATVVTSRACATQLNAPG